MTEPERTFVWFNQDLPKDTAELFRTRRAAVMRLMEKGLKFGDECKCGRLLEAELVGLKWIK